MKRLFVFDLDFTLWNTGNTWCDCTTPPYKWINNRLLDAKHKHLKLYPETIEILKMLYNEDYVLAIASRTDQPDWARQLIKLFEIDMYFTFIEIYPSSKIKHLTNIKNNSGYEFSDLIFYDDEYRNIEEVQTLGVHSIYVKNGINKSLILPYK